MESLKDLWRGVRRHPIQLGVYFVASFSIIYTLLSGTNFFIPNFKVTGHTAFAIIILVSLIYSLKKIWKPSKIEITIANSNTTIEILFGDLFQIQGIRVIPVNEYFDSVIGKSVSDRSLHGFFIKKCFGGYSETFDKAIDNELSQTKGDLTEKNEGKKIRYPIGTTVLVNINEEPYLVFALSKTDINTSKAYCNVQFMWDALHGLWQKARNEAGGHEVNLPLIGSGLSGVGLPTRDLLNLIILSAITETKTQLITSKVRVVLSKDRFEDLDLREIKEYWEKK